MAYGVTDYPSIGRREGRAGPRPPSIADADVPDVPDVSVTIVWTWGGSRRKTLLRSRQSGRGGCGACRLLMRAVPAFVMAPISGTNLISLLPAPVRAGKLNG